MNISVAQYIQAYISSMKIIEILNERNYDYVIQGREPNQFSANPITLEPNKEGTQEFNFIYNSLKNSNLNIMERTKSGAIVRSNSNRYCYDVRHHHNGGIITIYIYGRLYVFKLGHWAYKEHKDIQPYVAFNLFQDKCLEFGINLDDYAIKNGKEIKKEIPTPYIVNFKEWRHKSLTNVNHIDYHNSYPAGLVNTHPEFKPVVDFFYNGRINNPNYKAVLNYSIGMMQSINVKTVNAKWAHLSRDAILDNNNRLDELSKLLIKAGCDIIGYNTDGIWYRGDVFHGDGEGSNYGQWENDHINCRFRAKSNGAYEFIENGVYTPVVRGETMLDKEKSRDKWIWGDIYKTSSIILEWNDDEGFKAYESE